MTRPGAVAIIVLLLCVNLLLLKSTAWTTTSRAASLSPQHHKPRRSLARPLGASDDAAAPNILKDDADPGDLRSGDVMAPVPRDPPRKPHLVEYSATRTETDDLYYLRDLDDPDTTAQLSAERAFADETFKRLAPLQTELAAEALSATRVARSVPGPWRRFGKFEWRARLRGGEEHSVFERRAVGSDEIEVLLDANVAPCLVPSTFAGGIPFRATVSGVSHVAPSPSGEALLYTVDPTGMERYALETTSHRLRCDDVDAIATWADEDAIFIVRCDAAGRPWQLSLLKRQGDETVLFSERDERFRLDAPARASDGSCHVVSLQSRNATEILRVSLHQDTTRVVVAFRREPGRVFDACDACQGLVYAVSDNSLLRAKSSESEENFEISHVLTVDDAYSLDGLKVANPHRVALFGVARNDGRRAAWLAVSSVPDDDGEQRSQWTVRRLKLQAPWTDVEPRADLYDHRAALCFVELSSPIRFARVLEWDLCALECDEAQYPALPSSHESSPNADESWESHLQYESLRTSSHVGVPYTLVTSALSPDASSAVVLRAYGAYGAVHPTALDPATAVLARRGVGVAIAGVRGGGEQGPAWRDAGRGARNKRNSAKDVIDVASELVAKSVLNENSAKDDEKSVKKQRRKVGAWARSAGGLSVGGAAHLDEDGTLFDAIALDVPFLDALGTLADPTLPLTANEWEEFGDPREDFEAIRAYSPAEACNVRRRGRYPAMLLRPALQDARTGWWESFKFAARVRSLAEHPKPKVIVDLGEDRGHFAPGGIVASSEDLAVPLAFLLDHLLRNETDEDDIVEVATSPPIRRQALEEQVSTTTTTTTTFTVRAAAKTASSDLTSAAALQTAVFSRHLTSTGSLYLQTRRYEADLRDATLALVAVADSQIVGVAAAHELRSSIQTAWYVSAVAVDAAWRRRGVASALLGAIEDRGRSETTTERKSVDQLYLHVKPENDAAVSLYRRRGFDEVKPSEEVLPAPLRAELETHVGTSSSEDAPQLLLRKRL